MQNIGYTWAKLPTGRDQREVHILASTISLNLLNRFWARNSRCIAGFDQCSLCAWAKPKAYFAIWINITKCIMKKWNGLKVKNEENWGSAALELWQSKFGKRPSLKSWERELVEADTRRSVWESETHQEAQTHYININLSHHIYNLELILITTLNDKTEKKKKKKLYIENNMWGHKDLWPIPMWLVTITNFRTWSNLALFRKNDWWHSRGCGFSIYLTFLLQVWFQRKRTSSAGDHWTPGLLDIG